MTGEQIASFSGIFMSVALAVAGAIRWLVNRRDTRLIAINAKQAEKDAKEHAAELKRQELAPEMQRLLDKRTQDFIDELKESNTEKDARIERLYNANTQHRTTIDALLSTSAAKDRQIDALTAEIAILKAKRRRKPSTGDTTPL